MKVWIFVEGDSDRIALNTLWVRWQDSLKRGYDGFRIIPLQNKSQFFRKIGHRAAEKLSNNQDDLVVGLPDLYPNSQYVNSQYKHDNVDELKEVQKALVKENLIKVFKCSPTQSETALERFYPTAFKYDLEMLLLAAIDELRKVLNTGDALGHWQHPVENQNQMSPPKRVVEALFRTRRKISYRDTVHARAVLEKVADINTILYGNKNELQCPVFKSLMDWIGDRTGVPAC